METDEMIDTSKKTSEQASQTTTEMETVTIWLNKTTTSQQ